MDRIATPGASAYYASKWAVAGSQSHREIKVSAVEPGGMETDFAEDSSLKIVPIDSVFDDTVGAIARIMKSPEYAAQLRDPAKVANVILQVAAVEQPPLPLIDRQRRHAISAVLRSGRCRSR